MAKLDELLSKENIEQIDVKNAPDTQASISSPDETTDIKDNFNKDDTDTADANASVNTDSSKIKQYVDPITEHYITERNNLRGSSIIKSDTADRNIFHEMIIKKDC